MSKSKRYPMRHEFIVDRDQLIDWALKNKPAPDAPKYTLVIEYEIVVPDDALSDWEPG